MYIAAFKQNLPLVAAESLQFIRMEKALDLEGDLSAADEDTAGEGRQAVAARVYPLGVYELAAQHERELAWAKACAAKIEADVAAEPEPASATRLYFEAAVAARMAQRALLSAEAAATPTATVTAPAVVSTDDLVASLKSIVADDGLDAAVGWLRDQPTALRTERLYTAGKYDTSGVLRSKWTLGGLSKWPSFTEL